MQLPDPYVVRIFLYLCIWTIPQVVQAQYDDPKFTRLTSNEGLSQDHVSAIVKDRDGFMWFATDEGLNKYDGYKFTVYKHDPGKKETLSSNYVLDVLEDHEGRLWVGTTEGLDQFDPGLNAFKHYSPPGGAISVRDIFQDGKKRMWIATTRGLYLFDPGKNTFRHYKMPGDDANQINANFIYRICEGEQGELWIATREGLKVFDSDVEKFTIYKHDPANRKSIGADRIKSVYKDKRGNVWIGTQSGGVALYDRKERSFINFYHDPGNPNSLSHNDILSFAESPDDELWIGTENGGVSVYNYKSQSFRTTYRNDLNRSTSLSNNSIYSIYQDDIGNMWVGTWSGGVNLLPRFGLKFAHYRQIPGDENSLSSNLVLSIRGDSDGNIWIGTDGGGLNLLDWKTKTFRHYRHTDNKNSIGTDYVLAITELEKDVLGIGYHRGGFDIFNRKTNRFTHHLVNSGNLPNPSGLSVHVIFQDKKKKLWIGTYDRNGLYLYDPNHLYRYESELNEYVHYASDPGDERSIGGNIIYSMFEDSEGALWIGTNGGLELFDRKNNEFIHHRFDPRDPNSISNNVVYSIMEDHNGNLWLGTGGGGLNFYDRKKKTFKAYGEKDGLPNNVVYGILEDSKGNLWFSSNRGLSRFNPITQVCRNFSISDGLQGNSFKPNACYQTPEGEMFFGGTNGFNVFHPEQIEENPVVPPVWITGFRIFNEPVGIGEDSPLKVSITETRSISLSHDQSMFSFEFAALNYTAPEKNQYAYMLEGFDKDWNYVGTRRTATYTNLDPGEYIFKVKASNNDGVWNHEGASLKITITPPFWQTLGFRAGVIIFILGSIFSIYKLRVTSIQKQKARLKRKVRKRTLQIVRKNEEINAQANEIKAINENLEMLVRNRTIELERKNKALERYAFINAHKLRGPLASILGLIELMSKEEMKGECKVFLGHLKSSAEQLDATIHTITAAIEGNEANEIKRTQDNGKSDGPDLTASEN